MIRRVLAPLACQSAPPAAAMDRRAPASRPIYIVQEPNYYDVLDVDTDASASAIVRAYRQMALKFHPDRNPSAEPERFQQITEAYEVLSNPEKRRLYDHYGPSLRPQLGESVAKLAPLLLSLSTGFLGASAHTFGWLRGGYGLSSGTVAVALELGVVGLAGLYYCYPPGEKGELESPSSPSHLLPQATRRRQEAATGGRREVVSVSDYIAVSGFGLVLGNASGWISASVVVLVRSLLLHH